MPVVFWFLNVSYNDRKDHEKVRYLFVTSCRHKKRRGVEKGSKFLCTNAKMKDSKISMPACMRAGGHKKEGCDTLRVSIFYPRLDY